MNPEATFEEKLIGLLDTAGLYPLTQEQLTRLVTLYSLFVRWNSRINLSAIRDEDSILSRHFVESIACAQSLPRNISSVLDFGSGSGFPGLPITLCRPECAVTLAESQGKKVAYLREAVRVLGLGTSVHGGRAEDLNQLFGCVVLRAVDRMEIAVKAAANLVAPGGWLALMVGGGQSESLRTVVGEKFLWSRLMSLAGGRGALLLGRLRDRAGGPLPAQDI